MKPQLQLVKQALAGPNATAATSRMVKHQDGRLWAYGGAFCLSTPLGGIPERAFYPDAVLAFFSRDREGYSCTEHGGLLIFRHKKWEPVKVRTVPADIVPVLQAVGKREPVTEPLIHLNTVAKLCRNTTADWSQGAWFSKGMIFAIHRHSLCFATFGLTFDHEPFCITADAMSALAGIKAKLIAVVIDRQAVQFEFEDGTWLAARKLEFGTGGPPDFMAVFVEPEDCVDVGLDPEVAEEVQSLSLKGHGEEGVEADMIWTAEGGTLSFVAPDGTEGSFENACNPDLQFRIKGEGLRTALALVPEVKLAKQPGDDFFRSLNGYGEGFAVAVALTR